MALRIFRDLIVELNIKHYVHRGSFENTEKCLLQQPRSGEEHKDPQIYVEQ